MDKFNLVFCKFTIDKSIDSKSFYADLIRKEYSEIDGWGFSDVDIVDDVVSATLLKSITAYYRSWNTETSEMERQSYSMVKDRGDRSASRGGVRVQVELLSSA